MTTFTFSLESAVGRKLCDWLAGRLIARYGPGAAPANRFRVPANSWVRKMNGTSGRNSTASSASAALNSSLGSRLQAGLDVNGSMEYRLTWKSWGMESGRRISALRASGRRTFGSGCSGERSGWGTPRVTTNGGIPCLEHTGKGSRLEDQAATAGWITPASRDHKGGNEHHAMHRAKGCQLDSQALLAGWNSPRATDGSNGGPNQTGGALSADVALTGWPSPNCCSPQSMRGRGQDPLVRKSNNHQVNLQDATFGLIPPQSSAEMEKPAAYRLNPRFSLWLMGYPAVWACSGARAMQSCRKSRRNSSKHS